MRALCGEKVLMALSTLALFFWRKQGLLITCVKSQSLAKAAENWGPLSVTAVSGTPCHAKPDHYTAALWWHALSCLGDLCAFCRASPLVRCQEWRIFHLSSLVCPSVTSRCWWYCQYGCCWDGPVFLQTSSASGLESMPWTVHLLWSISIQLFSSLTPTFSCGRLVSNGPFLSGKKATGYSSDNASGTNLLPAWRRKCLLQLFLSVQAGLCRYPWWAQFSQAS